MPCTVCEDWALIGTVRVSDKGLLSFLPEAQFVLSDFVGSEDALDSPALRVS